MAWRATEVLVRIRGDPIAAIAALALMVPATQAVAAEPGPLAADGTVGDLR